MAVGYLQMLARTDQLDVWKRVVAEFLKIERRTHMDHDAALVELSRAGLRAAQSPSQAVVGLAVCNVDRYDQGDR